MNHALFECIKAKRGVGESSEQGKKMLDCGGGREDPLEWFKRNVNDQSEFDERGRFRHKT